MIKVNLEVNSSPGIEQCELSGNWQADQSNANELATLIGFLIKCVVLDFPTAKAVCDAALALGTSETGFVKAEKA
jgi:hypothetical protein